MTDNSQLIDLNNYIGKPYKLGARGPNAFDCWGLVMDIYKKRGIELPDWNADALDLESVSAAIESGICDNAKFNYAERVEIPNIFDIAIIERGARAVHCGLYVSGGILHASALGCGVVHDSLDLYRAGKGSVIFYRCLNG